MPWHRRLRQHPTAVVPWLVAAGLAALAGLAVGRLASAAEAARSQWGQVRSVLVVSRPVDAGEPLAGAVSRVERPVAMVPHGAPNRLPPGARAGRSLVPGEVMVPTAVRSSSLGGTDAGRRIIAVAQPEARLRLEVGDRVDVWSTIDPSLAGDGPAATTRAAEDAEVVDVRGATVSLAVAEPDLPAVAEASALGAITLVGAPGGPVRGS